MAEAKAIDQLKQVREEKNFLNKIQNVKKKKHIWMKMIWENYESPKLRSKKGQRRKMDIESPEKHKL